MAVRDSTRAQRIGLGDGGSGSSTSAAAESIPTCSAASAVPRIADPVGGQIAGRVGVAKLTRRFPTLDATAFPNNMSKAAAGLYGEADPGPFCLGGHGHNSFALGADVLGAWGRLVWLFGATTGFGRRQ